MTPIGSRILIQRLESPEKVGSLYIPDSAKDHNQQAKVIALGTGKDKDGKEVSFSVKEGDTVLVPSHIGTEVKQDGHTMHVILESEVLGIFY